MIYLKELEPSDEKAFMAFSKRYKEDAFNETIPYSLNPENLTFQEFYHEISLCKQLDTLPDGFVLAKYYLILDENKEIVGGINIRYHNDFILNCVGHVGYGIAPWERGKGYAKDALKRMLLIAKELGLNRILLITDIDNAASQHVILANGGVLTKVDDRKQFYWITLGDWQIEESAMAIVLVQNKILATKENIYGRVVLSLPKGHVEENETHIDTAIRECYEETGIGLSRQQVVCEMEPFIVCFVDHHLKLVKKSIYPILFKASVMGKPMIQEERIVEVAYLDVLEFIKECSYDNVRKMVEQAVCYISSK